MGIFKSRWLALIHDLSWIPVMVAMAFLLRFNFEGIPESHIAAVWQLMFVAILVQFCAFYYFGLYRGIWRFASIPDLVRILKAVLIGSLITFLILFVWQRLEACRALSLFFTQFY